MDPVGNLLTKIRNASAIRAERVEAPLSHLTKTVLKVLKRERYVTDVIEVKEPETGKTRLAITLRYVHGQPAITRVRRLSKPGRRVYAGVAEIPRPVGGRGTIVLSTTKGVMTDREAKKQGIGGEVLFEVIRGEEA